MEPIGPLMWEHRTIEKAVGLLEQGLETIRSTGKLGEEFLLKITDFFRMYADRTHHGKEEDILFKALQEKSLSSEHKKIMKALMDDHVKARELIKQINDGQEVYAEEKAKGLKSVNGALESLLRLYPRHIENEDKHFFFPAMEYFTEQEKEQMLREFHEFDQQLIHERYKAMLREIEDTLRQIG